MAESNYKDKLRLKDHVAFPAHDPPAYSEIDGGSSPSYGFEAGGFNNLDDRRPPPGRGHPNATQNAPQTQQPTRRVDTIIVLGPGMVQRTTRIVPVDIKDYMPLAICSIFCCFFLGIFAIVQASNAKTNKAAGNLSQAKDNSRNALNLSILAIIFGLILTAICIAVNVA